MLKISKLDLQNLYMPCCENSFVGIRKEQQVLGEVDLVKEEATGRSGEGQGY